MSGRRFSFVKDKDVEETREGIVPRNTRRHTLWSSNCYNKWLEAREIEFRDFEPEDARFRTIPKLEDISIDEMNYWLSKFVLEVRKHDGTDYRHEVLYSLFCGINRVIKEKHPELSLFHSTALLPFQQTLDGRLKELQATQKPFKKQSDAISVNDETTMWEKGVFGTHSPEAVINTLLFLSAKLFVLRGGRELRSLTHEQIEFEERADGTMCVTYREMVSKTNQGGLKRRKVEPKVVQHVEDPLDEKSFTFIYHFYVNKCPDDVERALFLRAREKWKFGDELWFERSPIGHNLLQSRFKEMCKQAGLVGNFTNHSIRATAITRMYDSGLAEKMIMKRSGHRSSEGVRAYQREDASAVVKVSNALSSSRSLVANTGEASSTCNDQTDSVQSVAISEEDRLLVNACIDCEKRQSQINLGGILQGANVGSVNINININKN